MKRLNTTKFILVGNNLCVDFVNTEIVVGGEPKDLLNGFEDLIAWKVAVKVLTFKQGAGLLEDWGSTTEAASVFRRGLNFRSLMHEMIAGLARGKAVKRSTIGEINLILRTQNGYSELHNTAEGFAKHFFFDFGEPQKLLAPIAAAAADLLCYGNPRYIKKCENPDCVLYFYDTSKNHSRRWCSMGACGNRAKAAAFYQRQSGKRVH